MKLCDWAKKNGISYKTAHRWFQNGTLPVKSEQMSTGTILVYENEKLVDIPNDKVVIYARVSSRDQKSDLARQSQRLHEFCVSRGLIVVDTIEEIGSGLNGKRSKLRKMLGDPAIKNIVVENKDRLTRFGFEYIEAVLASTDRTILVASDEESKNDLIQDFVNLATCMCAKIYGQRSAKNRASRALKAADAYKTTQI